MRFHDIFGFKRVHACHILVSHHKLRAAFKMELAFAFQGMEGIADFRCAYTVGKREFIVFSSRELLFQAEWFGDIYGPVCGAIHDGFMNEVTYYCSSSTGFSTDLMDFIHRRVLWCLEWQSVSLAMRSSTAFIAIGLHAGATAWFCGASNIGRSTEPRVLARER